MGNFIYRYRKISDYSIKELMDDTIVGSTSDFMNDPYDCKFYYNYDLIKQFLESDNNFLDIKKKYCKFFDLTNFSLDDFISFILYFIENIVSKSFYIACFSKYNNKEIMWSHYADNGKGFVLEYDKNDIVDGIEKEKEDIQNTIIKDSCCFIDVKYCKKRTDNTEFLEKFLTLMIIDDNFLANMLDIPKYKFMIDKSKKIITEKNFDWKYENESRIVWPNLSKVSNLSLASGHKTLIYIVPKSIYIGEKCSEKDILLLYSIAKNKKIQIYKMRSNNKNEKYRLDAIKVTNDEVNNVLNNYKFGKNIYSEMLRDYMRHIRLGK